MKRKQCTNCKKHKPLIDFYNEKTFTPQLAPNNEIDIKTLPYSLLGSVKLDGCRLLSKEGWLVTRSLKNLQNIQLNQKFEFLRKYSEDNNVILDGELYAHGIPFQFIVSCFMTKDCTAKSAIKKWDKLCEEHDFHMSREEVLENIKFHMFDTVTDNNFEEDFQSRINKAKEICDSINSEYLVFVEHKLLETPEEVEEYFQEALNNSYEGLILRNPEGRYKFNRCTVGQNIIFKYKPFITTDSKIIGIVQATEVNEDAEKTTNELGRSRTSKRAEDRHTVEKAQSFSVDFEGQVLKVTIAMTDEQKKYIWTHQDEYIGKWVEYKYMEVGMKEGGLPRIPKFIRMREDK